MKVLIIIIALFAGAKSNADGMYAGGTADKYKLCEQQKKQLQPVVNQLERLKDGRQVILTVNGKRFLVTKLKGN